MERTRKSVVLSIIGIIVCVTLFIIICVGVYPPDNTMKSKTQKADTLMKIDSINNMKYTIILTPLKKQKK